MKTKTREEIKAAFDRWRAIRNRIANDRRYTDWDATREEAHLLINLIWFASDEIADHCLRYWAMKPQVKVVYPSEQFKKQAARACRNLLERKTEGWGAEENADATFDDGVWSKEYWAWKWETATTGTVDTVCGRFGLKYEDLDSLFYA